MNEPSPAPSWAATSATRYSRPSARASTATRLFLEERVASLLDTGALHRDGDGLAARAGRHGAFARGARAADPIS